MSERMYKTLHDEGIAETVVDSENYSEHVSAMTGEGLHSKRDIAAELAYRDIKVESLQAQLELERGKRKEAEQSLVGVIKWFRSWIVEGGLNYDNCIAKEVHDEILATHTKGESDE